MNYYFYCQFWTLQSLTLFPVRAVIHLLLLLPYKIRFVMLQKNPANQGRKFQLCVLLHSRNQVGIMTSTWFFKTQRHTDTVHWISLTHLSRLVWKLVVRVATGKTIEFLLFFLSFFSLWPVPSTIPQFCIIVSSVELCSLYYGTNIISERPTLILF